MEFKELIFCYKELIFYYDYLIIINLLTKVHL